MSRTPSRYEQSHPLQERQPVSTKIEKFLTANSTASSWASLATGTSIPTTAVGPRSASAVARPDGFLSIIPFGVGANNATFDMRIIGIRRVDTDAYIQVVLAQLACTLSQDVGDSGQIVTDSERFCDTISQTFGPSGNQVISPTGDVRGWVLADLLEYPWYLLDFKVGTATSANALIGMV